MIQAVVIVLSGVLFSIGGYNLLIARRYGIPILLSLASFYLTKDLWCFSMLSACVFLSLGYGDKSLFRHIFGDGWGRGIWSLLVSLSLSIPLLLTGHLPLYFFVPYVVACFFVEPLFKNLYQIAGDFIIGCCFASIILIIR